MLPRPPPQLHDLRAKLNKLGPWNPDNGGRASEDSRRSRGCRSRTGLEVRDLVGGVRHRRLSEATPHRRGLTFLNYKVTMRPALRYTSVFARHHLLAQRSSLLGPGPSLLRRPRRAPNPCEWPPGQ